MSNPNHHDDQQAKKLIGCLANKLVEYHCVSNDWEAFNISEAIFVQARNEQQSDDAEEGQVHHRQELLECTMDYFSDSLSPQEIQKMMDSVFREVILSNDSDSSKDDDNENHSTNDNDDSEASEENELMKEGECELCERFIQLTKHHLIPKSTWPRIETRLLHAAEAISSRGDEARAQLILQDGFEHFLPILLEDTSKLSIKRRCLQQTCEICRPCHSAIHRTHDNITLALQYNTIDKMLHDDKIRRFCKWANKQKPGKYAMR